MLSSISGPAPSLCCCHRQREQHDEASTVTFPRCRYGTPEVDGEWRHWNHEVLPHWSASVREKYPSGVRFKPPGEAHSPFYPHRGLYSSNDKVLLKTQLEELMRSGVGVVVLSWSGRPDLPGEARKS